MPNPKTGEFKSLEDELRFLVSIRRKVALDELAVITEMLENGRSYADVAVILGTTRQNVRQRFGHIAESSGVKGSKDG